jgi:hypothetical protein
MKATPDLAGRVEVRPIGKSHRKEWVVFVPDGNIYRGCPSAEKPQESQVVLRHQGPASNGSKSIRRLKTATKSPARQEHQACSQIKLSVALLQAGMSVMATVKKSHFRRDGAKPPDDFYRRCAEMRAPHIFCLVGGTNRLRDGLE